MKRFGSFVAVFMLAVVVAYSIGRAQESKTVKHPDRFLGFFSVGDRIILDDNVRRSGETVTVGYRVRIVSAEYFQKQDEGRDKRTAELKALTEELKALKQGPTITRNENERRGKKTH